jgi:hypothetical protein
MLGRKPSRMRGGPMPRIEQDHRFRSSYPGPSLIECEHWRQTHRQQEGQEMVVSRHYLLRSAAAEYQWLGLSSSRWKSFLRHMDLPHPAVSSWTFPSTTLAARSGIRKTSGARNPCSLAETISLIRGCDLSETAGMTHQLEGRDDGAANRGGGTACVEFAESRAARATIGGTTKHQTPA